MTTLLEERPAVGPAEKPALTHPSPLDRGPVLLVRLGAMGDVVRALPALDLLRRTYPATPIDWLVEERSADLLQGHPALRRVIVFRRRELVRRARALRLLGARRILSETVTTLRQAGYEAVVDLQGTFKSGYLTRATKCALRIGLAPGHAKEGAHRCYTQTVNPGSMPVSRVERNFRLLRPLGVDSGIKPPPRATVPMRDPDRAWAQGALSALALGDAPRVLLYPGTSEHQAYKRWPADRYGVLAGRLHDAGVHVLLAGGPGEEGLLQKVCAATSSPPAVVPASTLRQLTAVLAGMDVFVGGDTGPMHLAAAVGARVLGLFGATDPAVNGPYDPGGAGHRVLYHGPALRPYRVKGARARQWMDAISVEEVESAVREMLR
jgi:lipopolysaccharide heptosyltransferase I